MNEKLSAVSSLKESSTRFAQAVADTRPFFGEELFPQQITDLFYLLRLQELPPEKFNHFIQSIRNVQVPEGSNLAYRSILFVLLLAENSILVPSDTDLSGFLERAVEQKTSPDRTGAPDYGESFLRNSVIPMNRAATAVLDFIRDVGTVIVQFKISSTDFRFDAEHISMQIRMKSHLDRARLMMRSVPDFIDAVTLAIHLYIYEAGYVIAEKAPNEEMRSGALARLREIEKDALGKLQAAMRTSGKQRSTSGEE